MKYENILILKANMKETEISEEIKSIKEYLKNHNINLVSFENLGKKHYSMKLKIIKMDYIFKQYFMQNKKKKKILKVLLKIVITL